MHLILSYLIVCGCYSYVFSEDSNDQCIVDSQDVGLLQRDFVLPTTYENYYAHPCNRRCVYGKSKTCYYKFVVDYYETWSDECRDCPSNIKDCFRKHCITADGVKTQMMAINYMFPSPVIEGCYNDTIIVDVHNRLLESTTMHWHGIHHHKTPFMDGVPYLTQYPINPSETFRYKFEMDRPGTMWYHSHSGMQRAFGLSGVLIARRPQQINPHYDLYDVENSDHIIFLNDWSYDFNTTVVRNCLINGKGRNQKMNSTDMYPDLYSHFFVKKDIKYLFRLVFEGFANCPLRVSIDNHKLLVIRMDGNDIKPVLASSVVILSGERIDFILYTNKRIDNYWIRVHGYNNCNGIYQAAILRYKGAELKQPKAKLSADHEVNGVQINPSNKLPEKNSKDLAIIDLRSLTPTPWTIHTKFETYHLQLGVRIQGGLNFNINNITSIPTGFAVLPSLDLFHDDHIFCNKSTLAAEKRNCAKEVCKCTHAIQLNYNRPTEIIVSNDMIVDHPIHLHGYSFHVVGMGILDKDRIKKIKQIDKAKPFPRNNWFPPVKDTVQVFSYGYTIIRFNAINPGYWLFHCHIETHANLGMMTVLKVGQKNDMVRTPSHIKCN